MRVLAQVVRVLDQVARALAIVYGLFITFGFAIYFVWEAQNPITQFSSMPDSGEIFVIAVNFVAGVLLIAGSILWYGWEAFYLRLCAFAIMFAFAFYVFVTGGVSVGHIVYAIGFWVALAALWPRNRQAAPQGRVTPVR